MDRHMAVPQSLWQTLSWVLMRFYMRVILITYCYFQILTKIDTTIFSTSQSRVWHGPWQSRCTLWRNARPLNNKLFVYFLNGFTDFQSCVFWPVQLQRLNLVLFLIPGPTMSWFQDSEVTRGDSVRFFHLAALTHVWFLWLDGGAVEQNCISFNYTSRKLQEP